MIKEHNKIEYETFENWGCDECGVDMVYIGNGLLGCNEDSCSLSIDSEYVQYDYMRHHDLFLELKCFNSQEILERLIKHFEENLECIKKNEPVKNNLQWYWDIESYRR